MEEAPRKKEGIKGDVYVMIPPKPFQRGPPLNSTSFLRFFLVDLSHRKAVLLRGAPNCLVFRHDISKMLNAQD